MIESENLPTETDSPARSRVAYTAIWSVILGVVAILTVIVRFELLESRLEYVIPMILGAVALVLIKRSKGKLRGKRLAVLGLVLGAFASVPPPPYCGILERGVRIKTESDMKNMILGCRIYAMDWEREYPEKLTDLFPDYIDHEPLFKVTMTKRDEYAHWIYFSGLKETDDPNRVLMASPIVTEGKRVVGLCGGNVSNMKEVKYQELLKTFAKPSEKTNDE